MLAATEALKPKSPPQSAKKKTKKNRILSKLADLVGRRRCNESQKDKKPVKDGNPEHSEADPRLTESQQARSAEPLRALCKEKLARNWTSGPLVEKRIPRKPVPNDGVHLEARHANIGGTSAIPYATPYRNLETRTEVDLGVCAAGGEANTHTSVRESGGKELDDCRGSQTRLDDPFESERSFDNLQGFLTSQPITASTPRASGDWFIGTNFPHRRPSPPERLSHFSANDADDELTDDDRNRAVYQRIQGRVPGNPTLRVQAASTNITYDGDDIEPERVKKHPSPSKASLDELSRQFEILLSNANNHDELFTNTTGLSPVTAAFPHRPAMRPESQTTTLGRAEYCAFAHADPQASTVPLSSTARQLSTATRSIDTPFLRLRRETGEERYMGRQPAGGDPSFQPSLPRAGNIDKRQRVGGPYLNVPRGD